MTKWSIRTFWGRKECWGSTACTSPEKKYHHWIWSFRTLRRVEDTLKLLFCQGLNTDMQSELACRDGVRALDQFIDLAIRIGNPLCSRRSNRFTSPLSQTNQSSDDAARSNSSLLRGAWTLHQVQSILWSSGTFESWLPDTIPSNPQQQGEFVDFRYSNHCLYLSARKINISVRYHHHYGLVRFEGRRQLY